MTEDEDNSPNSLNDRNSILYKGKKGIKKEDNKRNKGGIFICNEGDVRLPNFFFRWIKSQCLTPYIDV